MPTPRRFSDRRSASAKADDDRRQQQREIVAAMRRESVLDRNIPLGTVPHARPDLGLTVAEYYAGKQERGEFGAFDDMRRGVGLGRRFQN